MQDRQDNDNAHRLHQSDYYQLCRQRIDGVTCRELLELMLEERWEALAMQACKEAGRASPTADDALLALRSLKHDFQGNLRITRRTVAQLLSEIGELSAPEFYKLLAAILSILAVLAGSAFFFGTLAH